MPIHTEAPLEKIRSSMPASHQNPLHQWLPIFQILQYRQSIDKTADCKQPQDEEMSV